ncbi:FliH/SctL family protein [Leifsonia sp. NPDC080035]|uniref:FliH/SctL family protein n=1 Tax=Leifsonia sp. NPDC080035 TaxID=3143936 RepID=A0AAU7GFV8_9MICO
MSNDVAFAPLTVPVLAETEDQQATMTAARARGYSAGYADGLRAAAAEQAAWLAEAEGARAAEAAEAAEATRALATALRAAAVELREATVPVLEEAEATLVEAAFSLASAVVGDALSDRVAAARAAVARVLEDPAGGAVAVVRMNPADVALLGGADAVGPGAPRIVADAALAPGDAIGELPDGWLDGRIHAALERAKGAIG